MPVLNLKVVRYRQRSEHGIQRKELLSVDPGSTASSFCFGANCLALLFPDPLPPPVKILCHMRVGRKLAKHLLKWFEDGK